MDLELDCIDTEMSKTGSIACFSKQTIENAFECIVSCIILVSIIYIILLVLGLTSISEVNTLFYAIGYISLVTILSAPIGLYGSSSGRYFALFLFFVIASYHLYALIMYFWFNIRSSAIVLNTSDSLTNNSTTDKTSPLKHTTHQGFETLHHVTTGTYTALIGLSLVLVSCRIISNVRLIDSPRVIVLDNNPID